MISLYPFTAAAHRQADAGVSAGWFNEGIARFDATPSFRPLDHPHRNAFFDTPTRVHELALSQKSAAEFFADAVEPDERSLPHHLEDVFVDARMVHRCRHYIYERDPGSGANFYLQRDVRGVFRSSKHKR